MCELGHNEDMLIFIFIIIILVSLFFWTLDCNFILFFISKYILLYNLYSTWEVLNLD